MLFNQKENGEWEFALDLPVGIHLNFGTEPLAQMSKTRGIPLDVLQKAFAPQLKHMAVEMEAAAKAGEVNYKASVDASVDYGQEEAAEAEPKHAKRKKAKKTEG